ncbi:MAG: aspartyl protease family protein [Chitinophagaceae bacterium]|nr:aspartyl protease family protein [Chitinophagaceae bacterium]
MHLNRGTIIKTACLIFLYWIALTGFCQYGTPPPPKKTKGPVPITEFGFSQLYGGIIIVHATIDNLKDSLNFILDTGSGGISLDSSTVEEFNIPAVPSSRTIRGIAGVRKVDFAYNHTLNLPGLSVDSLDFHINNYEMLTGVYGMKIDGIIGYSFLKRYIIAIDFDRHTISVFPQGPFKYPQGGHILRPAITALPMQYAEITENETFRSRYFLDTGAGLCLLLSQQFTGDSAVFSKQKRFYTSVAEGIGGKKTMLVTTLKKFKLGPYKFRKMPVYVFDDEYNVTTYPFLAGLIGNDLLRRFNMTINYAKSEFHLVPNNSFREAFDYAYTGFNMFQEGMEVIIMDVMQGSPAEKAGLKDGDVIISIGNKFAGDLQTYKNILQQPGNKVKMVISRNGALQEIKLNIVSIKEKNKKLFKS